jgi:hypothetical protein
VVLERQVVGHREGDRRDRHLEGHPLPLDRAEDLVEVEAGVQANGGPGLDGGEEVQQPEDVRRRRGHLEAVLRSQPERVDPVGRGPGQGGVGVADGLGQARGARAEDEHDVGVRRWVGPLGRPAAGGDRRIVEVGDRGAEEVGQERERRRFAHPVDRAGGAEGVADLHRLPHRAEEDDGGAELAEGRHDDQELDPVAAHQRDPVARTDAPVGQEVGDAVAPGVEVGEGPLLGPGPDRATLAEAGRGSPQPAVQHRGGAGGHGWGTSSTTAVDMPPPAHMAATPVPPPRRRSSCTRLMTMRAPVAAIG